MIKDPLNNKTTPYEILDLTPYADHDQVHQSLSKFMHDRVRLTKFGMGLAQEARRKLTDPKERIGIDIFYYSMDEIPDELTNANPIEININEFLNVPLIKEEEIYTDLDKTDFTDELEDIQFNKIKLSDLSKYDKDDYMLEMIFDK
jgi:hypothetical protein